MKRFSGNKFLYIYLVLLIVTIVTVISCFVGISNKFKINNYSDFSNDWYSNGQKIEISDAYKYKEISKTLPIINEKQEIYFNVKNLNIDVYVDNDCVYKYENYNKRIYGKTPGSYFIKIDLDNVDSLKKITFKIDNPYNNNNGNITEIYIGDGTKVILDFISNNLSGIIISSIIVFIGIALIAMFIPLKMKKVSDIKMICLGLFAIIAGIAMVFDSKVLQMLHGNEYLYQLISELLMMLIIVPLILFVGKAYTKSSNKMVVDLLCIAGILNFVVSYILNLVGIFDLHDSLQITHFTLILGVIYIIYVGIKSFVNKDKQELWHTIGLVCVCACYLLDTLIFYTHTVIQTTFFTRIGILVFLCIEGVQFALEFLKMYQEQDRIEFLSKLAYQDGLTELLNRTSFQEDMVRLKDCTNGLIAVFDVNDLKYVNDNFGHKDGDRLIIRVAKTIKDTIGKYGKCYRIGGDELVFISDEKNVKEQFLVAYTKMLTYLDKYNKNSSKKYDISVAMGYAEITEKLSINKAFKIADSNMYENKVQMKKERKEKEEKHNKKGKS